MTVTQLTFAQSANSLFNDFSDKKNAVLTTVPKLATKLASSLLDKPDVSDLVKQVKTVKVLNLGDCSSSAKKKFAKKFKALTKEDYENALGVKSNKLEGSTTLIKQDGDIIKEIAVLNYYDDFCIGVLVTGEINVSDLDNVVTLLSAQ